MLVKDGHGPRRTRGKATVNEQNVVAQGMPLLGARENFIGRGKRGSRVVFSYISILPHEQK